jgi:hypothetical protein
MLLDSGRQERRDQQSVEFVENWMRVPMIARLESQKDFA